MSGIDPSRLYTQLLNTGLQVKNNPMYQLINSMIGSIAAITVSSSSSSSSGGGGGVTNNSTNIFGGIGIDNSDSSISPIPFSGLAFTNQSNYFSLINPIITLAESWIGPSSTAGIYFKSGSVGIGTTTPIGGLVVAGATRIGLGTTGLGAFLLVNGGAGQVRSIQFQSGSISRWQLATTLDAESGSNTGSNFTLEAIDDTGAGIDAPIAITRAAAGLITIGGNARPAEFTGSVGIGVNPASILHILSPTGPARITVDADSTTIAGIDLYNSGVHEWLIGTAVGGMADKHLSIYPYGGGNVSIGGNTTAPASRLAVTGNMTIGGYVADAAPANGLLVSGSVGLGLTSPTALLHIGAGTATASTSPLKFSAGTNLTTAEAGAMEYDGTNLYFTRAGTVRENVLVAIDGVSAPATTVGAVLVNYYGADPTNFLGDPNRWISVNILGSTYKIPLYS